MLLNICCSERQPSCIERCTAPRFFCAILENIWRPDLDLISSWNQVQGYPNWKSLLLLPICDRTHAMQYCPLKTAKFKDFQTHLEKKHQRKICNRCHSVFTATSNLKVHIKVVHEGVRKQKCGTCGKPFSHASNLSKHLKTVHGRRRQLLQQQN